jgi:thermitase
VEVDMLVPSTMIPNDPNYPSAWHHPKIGSPEAWDVTQGEGVIVATLDTGVDMSHPDLAENMIVGWNFYDNNSDVSDVQGHGTAVAGTMTEIGDNVVGSLGVAPKAKNIAIRISDPAAYAYFSAMASGITYAADHGARVANISYQNACGSAVVQNAGAYIRQKGGVAVIAAGNTGADAGFGSNTSITCASATDGNDVKAGWSSYGQYVDVAAPGVSVYTTVRGGGYGNYSGTSFASPVTAGIYALMFSVNPKLTPSEADSILFQTADDLGTVGWDMYYGHGRVNAGRAVQLAASTTGSLGDIDRTAPSTPVNLSATSITGTSVTMTWTPATDNVAVTGYDIYRNGVKIGTASVPSYTDTTVKGDMTYTYSVAARDAEGNVSAQSSTITVVTPAAPLAITSFAVSVKTGTTAQVAVNTSKAATVTIRYGLTATNLSLSMTGSGAATAQSLTLTGLKPKTKYFYQVTAVSGTETVQSVVSNFRTGTR